MKPRFRLASLCVITALCCVAMAASHWLSGIDVIMCNTGNHTLMDVVVHVTGNTYHIGDLGTGSQRRVRVNAAGDSHVELSFGGAGRVTKRLSVDCYFGPRGYRGEVRIDVSDDQIARVDDHIGGAYP